MHYPVVGRENPAPIDQTVAKGRSAVHEIGHFLGLRHIWGDGDCTEDDGIDDTPDAADASQQTCNLNSNTCVETPFDFPDMIENYMDYSDDRCQNMFTKQQIDIMRYILRTSRAGIVAETVIQYPASIAEIQNRLSAKVYPNPANNAVTIELNENQTEGATYSLYNFFGQKIFNSGAILSRTTVLNLSEFANGIYTLKIKSAEGERTEKIVLQK